MNGIKGKLWAKLIAIFIFVASAVVFAGSLIALIFLADQDAFFDNGKKLKDTVLQSSIENKALEIVYNIRNLQPFGLDKLYSEIDSETETMTEKAYEKTEESQPAIGDWDVGAASSDDGLSKDLSASESFIRLADYLDEAYSASNSNLYIQLLNSAGEKIYESPKTFPLNNISCADRSVEVTVYSDIQQIFAQFETNEDREKYIDSLSKTGVLLSSETKDIILDESENEDEPLEIISYNLEATYAEASTYIIKIAVYIPRTLEVKDDIFVRCEKISMMVEYRYLIAAALLISGLMLIISFIFVICSAGYTNQFEGLHLSLLHKLPLELYLISAVCIVYFLFAAIDEIDSIFNSSRYLLFIIAAVGAMVAVVAALFILLISTISARCKAGKLFHYTVTFGSIILAFRLIKYLIKNMNYYWRVALVLMAAAIYELFVLSLFEYDYANGVLFWLLGKIALAAVAVVYAIGIGKIKDTCKKLSAGNALAKVNPNGMPWDIKSLAQDVNSISDGIQIAVDEKTKSERLKTELITNVSHDLKTPLTSIVNYVDILSKQDIQPETAKEYVGVLVRQSQRMKKLIDDLVEASKASAGAIAVNPQRLDMCLLLTQAMTEYEEKLAKAEITPIVSYPDVPATVMVDGRLMWRVLDNLIGNICKYAQPQTRVYACVSCSEKSVVVVFKNISKYALNVSSEELMERFVRGDSSRHTEGSGLGLSIARSLCELQNVGFKIMIDGDLFKAQLTLARLPDIPQPDEKPADTSATPSPQVSPVQPAAQAQLPAPTMPTVTPPSDSTEDVNRIDPEILSQQIAENTVQDEVQSAGDNTLASPAEDTFGSNTTGM